MAHENLTFYEPTEEQLHKFNDIDQMRADIVDEQCFYYNDCSICPMAIHQRLLSTTKNTCTYGISEDKFRILMSDADCDY